MTTVAYHHKDKQIAIDSRLTSGSIISQDNAVKMIKNHRGTWLFSGSVCDYDALLELYHNDKVEVEPACQAFLIADSKCFFVTVGEHKYCEIGEIKSNFTLGSGSNFALAAMDFGCNAKEAVKYAITKDIYSGGRVRVFNLQGK